MTRALLTVHDLAIDTPGGRPLFRDLRLSLARGERVALVGRNGVGKSSLLDVLAGGRPPRRGRVTCDGSRRRVAQTLADDSTHERSPGQARRLALEQARAARPELLLLDEPTQGLDEAGIDWLLHWMRGWRGALVVVSHNRRLLRTFRDFFVVAETGCRHIRGSFEQLLTELEVQEEAEERRYVRNLRRLLHKERRNEAVRLRRERKKNVGRVRELGRGVSRAALNSKRGYAQESQGKRRILQMSRIDDARAWARAARRALSVKLPLDLAWPSLPVERGSPSAALERVSARAGERVLFEGLTLGFERERVAITGPNASGKTTLVELLTGHRGPDRGRATVDPARVGYVAQGSTNWRLQTCVLDHLSTADADTRERAAAVLRAHRFPLALAKRELASLSPGERLRAALICLAHRDPRPELLVLDEPTGHLDFLGVSALEDVLARWRGGLVVVSHDAEFLRAVGIEETYRLGAGRCRLDVR